MSTVLSFPRQARPSLRLVESEPDHRNAEIRAVVHHLAKGADLVMNSVTGKSPIDPAFVAAGDDIEAALFHILMVNGARNVDRPLIKLLAERHATRQGANNG